MPIGLGAALLIGSAASAGTQLYGAHRAASSAKDAAKTQQASADRALAVQQQMNAPYLAAGQRAAQQLMGPALANPYTQAFTGPGGSNGYQPFQPGPGGGPAAGPGLYGQPPPQAPNPMAQAMTVQLQGPDGSVRAVPAALAPQFIARGARRVV